MANINTIKVGSTSYGVLPASHASSSSTYGLGNDSNYGHVKLSDGYSSNEGSASSAIAASSKAVYDAYTALYSNKIQVLTSGNHLLKIPIYQVGTVSGQYYGQMKYPLICIVQGSAGYGYPSGLLLLTSAKFSNTTTFSSFTWFLAAGTANYLSGYYPSFSSTTYNSSSLLITTTMKVSNGSCVLTSIGNITGS